MKFDSALQTLPGVREFDPASHQNLRYLCETWQRVASRYAFSPYQAPTIEPTELYRRKSGGELAGQLFHWVDAGGREVALRPEVTPALARLAASHQREYKKPFKWHQFGPCFRYEKPQKGRLREFWQWNADLIGEDSPAADAELIALAIDCCRELGFNAQDLQLRLSDRRLWNHFFAEQNLDASQGQEVLSIIDRLEKETPEVIAEKLQLAGTSLDAVEQFLAKASSLAEQELQALIAELSARGMKEYISIEPRLVRGLAYYSGTVFELFDRHHGLRAVAGGGRYNDLIATLTGGKVDLPAAGFGMGDAVLSEFIQLVPQASIRRQQWLGEQRLAQVMVILADENPERRQLALSLVQQLRDLGLQVEMPLGKLKTNKQFERAEDLKARAAILVQAETIQLCDLSNGQKTPISEAEVVQKTQLLLDQAEGFTARDGTPPPQLA